MSAGRDIATIARWEVKKSTSMLSRDVLPVAVVLFVLLIIVTGFAAESGLHIQDGMYRIGVDDPQVAALFSTDARFTVYQSDAASLTANRGAYDLIIVNGQAYASPTDKGKSALNTLERDYAKYVNSVYNSENDLFAAYPLWIDTQTVKSELDFTAPGAASSCRHHYPGSAGPAGPVENVPTPSPTLGITEDQLRQELVTSSSQNTQISRYTDVLSPQQSAMGNVQDPDPSSRPRCPLTRSSSSSSSSSRSTSPPSSS